MKPAVAILAAAQFDFGTVFAIGVVLALVFAAIYASKKLKTVSPAKLAQLQSEAKEFFDKIIATGKITVTDNIPVVLGTDETALLHEQSKLIEARATRVYAGAGTRVKGIYIGGGQSSSVQALKQLDSGTLTLTTKRLVFTGSMESRVIDIKDIVSVGALADAIEISAARKAKRQVYVVHNPVLWGALLRTMSKGGTIITKKPVASSADIRMTCPHCGAGLSVEPKGAGRSANCPNCNGQIEIPKLSA